MASEVENRALVGRFWDEIWNNNQLAAADELVAEDFVLHLPSRELRGPEGLRLWVAVLRNAFPDIHFTIDQEIAEDDTVVHRWTGRATHRGELMGIAPTGTSISLTGISIFRISAGRIVEERASEDTLGLLQQLGAIPTPRTPPRAEPARR